MNIVIDSAVGDDAAPISRRVAMALMETLPQVDRSAQYWCLHGGLGRRASHATDSALQLRMASDATAMATSAPARKRLISLGAESPSHAKGKVSILDRIRDRWSSRSAVRRLGQLNANVFLSTNYVGVFAPPCGMVLMIHDVAFLKYPESFSASLVQRLESQLAGQLRNAAMVIVPSVAVQREVLAYYGISREGVVIAPYGIPSDLARENRSEVRKAIRAKYQLAKPFALVVGTVEPRRNLTTLLRVFHRLAQRGLGLSLVLVGKEGWLDDPLRTTLKSVSDAKWFRWLPSIDPDDAAAIYSTAQMVIIPSTDEGYGFVALEAMACGTALVVSNCASIAELVKDAAITFDADDEQAMAQAITQSLQDDAKRKELARVGFERAQRHRWSHTAKTIAKALHERFGS
jgi:glycosyltransferase involved in cell wall biosynthesis